MSHRQRLKHLLSIENLTKSQIINILDRAETFFDPKTKKILHTNCLQGKTIANLFFENSTRTRSTFELAAKQLSANVLNLDIQHSSTAKGESLCDTIRTIEAMQCEVLVIRHPQSGAAHFIAKQVSPNISVINAGDGCHAHPTQALLDVFTIRKYCGADFHKLTVAIIGDVKHSRVARSQIHALHLLGAKEIRIIGPKTLLPAFPDSLGVNVFYDINQGLEDVDIIITLRLQKERMQQGLFPDGNVYFQRYGLTKERLMQAQPNARILHPGPVNRGIEIQSDIADGPNSMILDQVTNGIAVRMAVMSLLSQANE